MSQFDVFENPEHRRQPNTPCLVVIQSDHFVDARTTVVVPLVRVAPTNIKTAANPSFEVNGERLTFEPFQIAFIPTRLLKSRVASLAEHRHTIVHAVDSLMSGLT